MCLLSYNLEAEEEPESGLINDRLPVHFSVSFEDNQFEVVPLTPEKVLELIEQAYPNPINPDDLAK